MISHHYVDIYQAAFQALLRRYAHSGMTDVVEHEDQGRSTTAGAGGSRSESEGAAAAQLNASIEILPSSSTSATSSGLPWLRSATETTVVTDAGGERGAIAGSSANSTPRSEDSSGSERGGTSSNGGIDERQQQQQHPELVFFDSPRVTPKQRLGGADGTVAGEEGRQKRAFTPARRLQV